MYERITPGGDRCSVCASASLSEQEHVHMRINVFCTVLYGVYLLTHSTVHLQGHFHTMPLCVLHNQPSNISIEPAVWEYIIFYLNLLNFIMGAIAKQKYGLGLVCNH